MAEEPQGDREKDSEVYYDHEVHEGIEDPFPSQGLRGYFDIPRDIIFFSYENVIKSFITYSKLTKKQKLIHLISILIITSLIFSLISETKIFFTGQDGWQETTLFEFEDHKDQPAYPFGCRLDSENNYHFTSYHKEYRNHGSTSSRSDDIRNYTYLSCSQKGKERYSGLLGDVMVLDDLPVIDDNGDYLPLVRSFCSDRDNNIYHIEYGSDDDANDENSYLTLKKWDRNGNEVSSNNITTPWKEFYFAFEDLSLEMDPEGYLHGVFIYNSTIRYVKLNTDGVLMKTSVIDPQTHEDQDHYPSIADIAIDDAGTIHLTWNICTRIVYMDFFRVAYSAVIYTKLSADGDVLQSKRISFTLSCLDFPAIDIDRDGNVHIISWIPDSIRPMYDGEFFVIRESGERSDTEKIGYPIYLLTFPVIWITYNMTLVRLLGGQAFLPKKDYSFIILLIFLFIPLLLNMFLPAIMHYPMFDGYDEKFFYFTIIVLLTLFITMISQKFSISSPTSDSVGKSEFQNDRSEGLESTEENVVISSEETIDREEKGEEEVTFHENWVTDLEESDPEEEGTNGDAINAKDDQASNSQDRIISLQDAGPKRYVFSLVILLGIFLYIITSSYVFFDDQEVYPYSAGVNILDGISGDENNPPYEETIQDSVYLGNNDLHTFPVQENAQWLNITLQGDEGIVLPVNDIDMYLYDADGELIADSTNNGTSESIDLYSDFLEDPGNFQLEVRWVQSVLPVDYTIVIKVIY